MLTLNAASFTRLIVCKKSRQARVKLCQQFLFASDIAMTACTPKVEVIVKYNQIVKSAAYETWRSSSNSSWQAGASVHRDQLIKSVQEKIETSKFAQMGKEIA